MLKFYYSLAPNPMKVALFLEEAGLPYEAVPVDTRKGEQHAPMFLAINPNAKVPAIVDGETTVFDSNAILLYLAEKTGQFLPAGGSDRGAMLSWLMFVASGIGPFTGQCGALQALRARAAIPYAINRYDFEAWRHWKPPRQRTWPLAAVDGGRAATRLLDMAVWGWARAVPFALGAEAWSATAAPEAAVRRGERTAGRAKSRRAEGPPCLQGGDGRRSPSCDVPAERAPEALRPSTVCPY